MIEPRVEGVELRPIPGIIGYAAGSDGHIYSFRSRRGKRKKGYTLSPQRLKGSKNSDGYLVVGLHWRGKHIHNVNYLIASAFHGPCPEGMESSHLNGDSADNRPENLAWETKRENSQRRFAHGTMPIGEKAPTARLTEEDVIAIRRDGGRTPQRTLARIYGVDHTTIGCALRADTWKHVA